MLATHRLTGQAPRRVEEMTEVVTRHAARQLVPLSTAQVRDWRAQLDHADAEGEFCLPETAWITLSSMP